MMGIGMARIILPLQRARVVNKCKCCLRVCLLLVGGLDEVGEGGGGYYGVKCQDKINHINKVPITT